MDLTTKKEMLLEDLAENGLIEIFDTKELDDYFVLSAVQSLNSGKCKIDVILCDEGYDSIYYTLGKLISEEKRDEMELLLNEFNSSNKVIKFYLNKDDEIMGEVVYINDEKFESKLLAETITKSFGYIEYICYSKIMKVIWS